MKYILVVILLVFGGWQAVHVGGTLNNGANAGLLYSNSNNSAGNSNANIGSQLSLYFIDMTTAALAEKHKSHYAVSSFLRKLHKTQAKMKRYNNLYNELISYENIRRAYYNARKGKRHYKDVQIIELDPEKYIDIIHDLLSAESYQPSEYTIFKKYTGGKIREIYKLPFFPDRIIHHCIVQVLYPIWTKLLIRDTYSTIPGRGIHDCVKRIKCALKDVKNTKYCLKLDVNKFYPSIDHSILQIILQRKIKDQKINNLLSLIIDSAPGIPIGNYISQWFGNIYLSYFDHYVKENLGVKYYFRYCDDLVLLSDDKNKLWAWEKNIREYLTFNLKLKIKNNYQVSPIKSRGIDFLGYKFYHTHTLVRKSIVKMFKSKIKNTRATKQTQSAYWGWFKHADAYNLTKKYFNENRKQG